VENDFYDKIPFRDEGLCMTNREAGIEPSKKLMSLFPENIKPLEYELRKNNLRDSVCKTRKNVADIMRAIEEFRNVVDINP
jgi:hypothetical protein